MPRKLWGEFVDKQKDEIQNEVEKMIPVSAKRKKLEEIEAQIQNAEKNENKNIKLEIKNPLVTQTIEVMQQTEMLQSLIDTYSGSSNYLLNPCQMIPEVDFPPENAADFVSANNKFAKPFWFIPPQNTPFVRGEPKNYPEISKDVCKASIRKSVCGQLRVAGYTDAAESALVLFTDAIDEFVHNFMRTLRELHECDPKRESQREVDFDTLERAYCTISNFSLTEIHNYYKHHVIARNRTEIAEFQGVLQEYDKLMKESQNMQKEESFQGDFFNILEMPQTDGDATQGGSLQGIVGLELHDARMSQAQGELMIPFGHIGPDGQVTNNE